MKMVLQSLMARSKFFLLALLGLVFMTFGASAQTEANSIIDAVSTAFDAIVPITVAIVTFFVVIRLAKRVVK